MSIKEQEQLYKAFVDGEQDLPMNDLRVTARRKLNYLGIIFGVLFLVLFVFFNIPVEQNLKFVLKGQRQEKIFRFAKVIHINELFVKSGKKVKKNDYLAAITSPEIVQFISEYKIAQRNLSLFYEHDTLIHHSEKISLELQIDELNLVIEQALNEKTHKDEIFKAEREKVHFRVNETQRRYDINEQLFKTKTISEFELKDSENEKIVAKSQFQQLINTYQQGVNSLQANIQRNVIARNILVEKLTKINLEQAQKESHYLHQCQIYEEKLLLNFGNFEIKGQNLYLRAAHDGQIAYIFDGSKELATNQILLKIIEVDSPLYAYAEITPDRVGFIKNNQKASLKVNTFPYYRWGVLEGQIRHLSKTPAANNSFTFEVVLKNLGKMQGLLQVGMTGEMSILTEEKTLLELAFENIHETKDKIVGF